jgi:GNAT superfamily N-acetyltransferase
MLAAMVRNEFSMQKQSLEISDLKLVIQEIETSTLHIIKPLILELNSEFSEADFDAHLSQMLTQNYRCAGLFVHKELVALAGFWIFTRFWCGKQCDIDNVFVSKPYRRQGFAKLLLQWVEALAKSENVETLVLDSYATAASAHQFYFNQGYFIKGFHFIKPLSAKTLTQKPPA